MSQVVCGRSFEPSTIILRYARVHAHTHLHTYIHIFYISLSHTFSTE